MATTIASATEFCMRGTVSLVFPAASLDATGGSYHLCFWSTPPCLGSRTHPKKFGARDFRPLRVYPKSSLSRQLSPGPRIHNRVWLVAARNPFRGALSWHLFAGDARRIRDARSTVWRELSKVFPGSADFFTPRHALSEWREQNGIRQQSLHRATLGLLVAWGLLVFKAYYLK